MAKGKGKTGSKENPREALSGVTADDLRTLMEINRQVASNIGAERGLIGQAEKKLEPKGFDPKVFKAIKSLVQGKNEAGITARKRTFLEYWEKLGYDNQGDLEDYVAGQRSDLDKKMDGDLPEGEGGGATVSDITADQKQQAAIRKFKDSLRECEEPALVNRAMEAFMSDHPDIDEEIVLEACQERFTQLAAQADAE